MAQLKQEIRTLYRVPSQTLVHAVQQVTELLELGSAEEAALVGALRDEVDEADLLRPRRLVRVT